MIGLAVAFSGEVTILRGQVTSKQTQIKKLQEQNKQLNKDLKDAQTKKAERDRFAAANQQPTRSFTTERVVVRSSIGGNPTIKAYILEVFGSDGRMAVAIAMAESGLNPQSTNWNDAKITGCPSYGIFQINRCDENLYNWKYNIAEAHKMFHDRYWYPWTVYTSGAYLQYL